MLGGGVEVLEGGRGGGCRGIGKLLMEFRKDYVRKP
jgi:hypothetical protein